MAYTTIDPTAIEVGDPITADLLTLVKTNFDDHETRILANSISVAAINLINEDVKIHYITSSTVGIYFVEVFQDCLVTEGSIQLFVKSPAVTGLITVDIKKNTTTNPSGFNSLFTTLPTLNMATASDYQRSTGVINPTYQNLLMGDILRVDITSLPLGLGGFRVNLIGVS